MRRIAAAVVILMFPLGAGTVAHAEPSGRTLALSCFSCHGPAGRSPDSIPGIHGKSEDFIAREMLAFRSGARRATVMGRIARGYTEQEIRALAKYLATLK